VAAIKKAGVRGEGHAFVTSAGEEREFLHEVRVSRYGGSWNVTVPFVFLTRADVPFAVCMPIGGQTAKGTGDVPVKGAGTDEDP
jgi:hypothetical protein